MIDPDGDSKKYLVLTILVITVLICMKIAGASGL